MCRIGLTNCPYCGSRKVYASTPRKLWEAVSVVFLLRLVRCHVCMHRHYRPIVLSTAKRPPKQRFMKYPAASLDQSVNRMLIKVKSM
jgi:hypothetical protein